MAEQPLSKQAKMAMASQFLGFMLDAYDMAMVLVMAPVLVKVFVSPKGSAALPVHEINVLVSDMGLFILSRLNSLLETCA